MFCQPIITRYYGDTMYPSTRNYIVLDVLERTLSNDPIQFVIPQFKQPPVHIE